MSKETDSRVRQTCFSVWAQLIHVLSVYDLDGFPSIFAVFDAVIEPLISLVVKNHRNQQVSPELSLHVLELFGASPRHLLDLHSVASPHLVHH